MPKISDILRNKFPHEPTWGQINLFNKLDGIIDYKKPKFKTLLVKGYAGTGKTTFLQALVQTLPLFNYKFILMAPTGRAAKVIASYTRNTAYTIHKKIYKQVADPDSGELIFRKLKNYHKKTVFVIDEASMLSDQADLGGSGLLSDVLDYVFESPGNRLILIGDTAQLPPVGMAESPALDINELRNRFHLDAEVVELKDVVRQEKASGILWNATKIREQIAQNVTEIKMNTSSFRDIFQLSHQRLEDGLRYAYDKYGLENTTIVTRSNWQAVQYNEHIRRLILYFENEIEAGDILMVVRNNYFYLEEDSPAGFIANGDFVEIRRIIDFEDAFGFRFATLELQMLDYPEMPPFSAKVILDTLHSKTASLSQDENRKLYNAVLESYGGFKTKKAMKETLRNDEYLNALQIKFAYALTCHKSQGGQWGAVFVDKGIVNDQQIDKEYLRWLYTSITRATDELYLLNFDASFFE